MMKWFALKKRLTIKSLIILVPLIGSLAILPFWLNSGAHAAQGVVASGQVVFYDNASSSSFTIAATSDLYVHGDYSCPQGVNPAASVDLWVIREPGGQLASSGSLPNCGPTAQPYTLHGGSANAGSFHLWVNCHTGGCGHNVTINYTVEGQTVSSASTTGGSTTSSGGSTTSSGGSKTSGGSTTSGGSKTTSSGKTGSSIGQHMSAPPLPKGMTTIWHGWSSDDQPKISHTYNFTSDTPVTLAVNTQCPSSSGSIGVTLLGASTVGCNQRNQTFSMTLMAGTTYSLSFDFANAGSPAAASYRVYTNAPVSKGSSSANTNTSTNMNTNPNTNNNTNPNTGTNTKTNTGSGNVGCPTGVVSQIGYCFSYGNCQVGYVNVNGLYSCTDSASSGGTTSSLSPATQDCVAGRDNPPPAFVATYQGIVYPNVNCLQPSKEAFNDCMIGYVENKWGSNPTPPTKDQVTQLVNEATGTGGVCQPLHA